MLKKLLIAALLCTLGCTGVSGIVNSMEEKVIEVEEEFYESDEFTEEEKDYIWNESWKVVEDHLSNLSFGGNSYDK